MEIQQHNIYRMNKQ